MENMEGKNTLTDQQGNRYQLRKLEISVDSETLGVFLTIDWNSDDQIKSLTKKSKNFAAKMRENQCDPNIAIYTYNTCFMKSMKYCMPVTHLSKEIWKSIINPVNKIALCRARMSSSFPTTFLYGSY